MGKPAVLDTYAPDVDVEIRRPDFTPQDFTPKHRSTHLSLLSSDHQKPQEPLSDIEKAALKERFFRDAEINAQLSAIMMNLTPQAIRSLEAMVTAKQKKRPYDQEGMELFCKDSQEIFSTLQRLGVTLLPLPEGRASFQECTAEEFLPMYMLLYRHRTDFQQGLFPMKGVTPLSVRPRQSWNEPHWNISQNNALRDFVAYEVPHYHPDMQSYKASTAPFRNIIMRVLEDLQQEFVPHPQEAQEFLYYLQREILPGLRRAVTHYTAWHSTNLYGPMSLPEQDEKTLSPLRILYDTHDAAVAAIADLDRLARDGVTQLPKKISLPFGLPLEIRFGHEEPEPALVRTMDHIRTKLEKIHVLDITV